MTIGGALSELNNLLNANDIPCYYKPSIKAVMDTIALEQEPKSEWKQDHEILKAYSDGASEVLDKIRAEIEEHAKINQNMNTDRAKALCWCLNLIDKYKAESEG